MQYKDLPVATDDQVEQALKVANEAMKHLDHLYSTVQVMSKIVLVDFILLQQGLKTPRD